MYGGYLEQLFKLQGWYGFRQNGNCLECVITGCYRRGTVLDGYLVVNVDVPGGK